MKQIGLRQDSKGNEYQGVYLKIGYTKDDDTFKKRIASYTTHCSGFIVLLTIPNLGKDVEDYLHGRFWYLISPFSADGGYEYGCNTEWFKYDQGIVDYLMDIKDGKINVYDDMNDTKMLHDHGLDGVYVDSAVVMGHSSMLVGLVKAWNSFSSKDKVNYYTSAKGTLYYEYVIDRYEDIFKVCKNNENLLIETLDFVDKVIPMSTDDRIASILDYYPENKELREAILKKIDFPNTNIHDTLKLLSVPSIRASWHSGKMTDDQLSEAIYTIFDKPGFLHRDVIKNMLSTIYSVFGVEGSYRIDKVLGRRFLMNSSYTILKKRDKVLPEFDPRLFDDEVHKEFREGDVITISNLKDKLKKIYGDMVLLKEPNTNDIGYWFEYNKVKCKYIELIKKL